MRNNVSGFAAMAIQKAHTAGLVAKGRRWFKTRTCSSHSRLWILTLASFFSYALALFSPCSAALTSQELFRKSERNVLVLELCDEQGKKLPAHTALLLGQNRAATECDLLDGAANIVLRQGNKTHSAAILHRDRSRNLCLLQVLDLPEGIEVGDSDPEVGSRVYAVSNALGLGISISEGVVSGIREANGEKAIQFTAPIAPGSEGGGLFDEAGRMVGVVNYQQRDGQNVNFALPARWLREIEKRAVSTDAAQSWRSRAIELAKGGKWRETAGLAAQWIQALPESPEPRLLLIHAQEQLNDWAAAEKGYRELLQRDHSSPAGVGLTAILLVQGKYREAAEAGRTALAVRREDGTLWMLVGAAEDQLGHTPEAKEAIVKAVQLAPWNRQALAGMVTMGRKHQEWNLALAAQYRIVEFEPAKLAARLELVDLLLSAGRKSRALAQAEKALDLDPGNGDAWLYKGVSLYALGRHRKAVDALAKGVTLNPTRSAQGWGWLGDVYAEMKLYPEAVNAYRQALIHAPDDISLKGRLGVALKDGVHLKEALALFETLRVESPADPLPWRQVCYVNSLLGQAEKAIPACEESLKLEPKQPKVWAALMEVYQQAGRVDDVRRSYQKLQAIDPGWAEYIYKRVLLPFEVTP